MESSSTGDRIERPKNIWCPKDGRRAWKQLKLDHHQPKGQWAFMLETFTKPFTGQIKRCKYDQVCPILRCHSRPSTQFQVMKRYCKLKFQSSPAAIYLSSVIISSSWWLAFHKVDSRCKDFKKTWQYVAMQSLSWSITKSRLGFHGILDQRSCSVSLQICCHQALHGKAISFM